MSNSISDILKKKRQGFSDKKVSGRNAYKFKGGVTTIRILPGWRKDDPTFSHSFGQAFIKDMDKNVLAVIGDRKITYGEDDAIRGLIQKALGEAATDTQREHWKEMLAKPRELVNALVLDDKEVDPKEPQIVDFSETQFDNILEQIELAGITEEFLDLENGFNLKVSKSGTGFNTKYSFTFDRKASPVDPSVMENITDLDAFVRSKFLDTDRAINALKSITTGAPIQRSLSYSGSDDIVDGHYSAVDDAKNVTDEVEVETVKVNSSKDIDKLFS